MASVESRLIFVLLVGAGAQAQDVDEDDDNDDDDEAREKKAKKKASVVSLRAAPTRRADNSRTDPPSCDIGRLVQQDQAQIARPRVQR